MQQQSMQQLVDALIKKILVVNISCCKNKSRKFNLLKFSKTGNMKKLPVLRVGDTIYIPQRSDSTPYKLRQAIGDIFKVISLGAIIGI